MEELFVLRPWSFRAIYISNFLKCQVAENLKYTVEEVSHLALDKGQETEIWNIEWTGWYMIIHW